MVQKRVTSVKLAMEKLEHFLELGGTKKDITLLVISGIALIASVCIGEDFTAGEVAFIMQLGGLLEELTVARARAGIEKLAHIRAYQAAGDKVCNPNAQSIWVEVDGRHYEIPAGKTVALV